ncbi:MAG: succinate dehydrogenase/fumarate reductase iron-sulfur subunit [Chloroflexi bacterium]|nr:succinate dehydrogenase/fumarate reductase iron-sulfur subunit [Chloroflexota bacterium]
MAEVTFKIYRYKPGAIDPPRYDTFRVDVEAHETVLDILERLRLDDPTLTYRHSCHHGSCGTCGMVVNGKEVLACVTRVLELGTDTVVVEPLHHFPLVSDLVVDMTPFFEKYEPVGMPYIRESEYIPEGQPSEEVGTYVRFESCLECGLCLSACPVVGTDPEYLGPAALAAAARVVQEPRGQDVASVFQMVDTEQGCWRCHAAMECSEVCPNDVDPGGMIMFLRRELLTGKAHSGGKR